MRRDEWFAGQPLREPFENDLSTAKSSFIRREVDVWGSLRFLRAALAEATERLSQRSAEAADLRLLCDELGVEAAATRAEAQRRQLELGQVIGERDQSRSQAAEAESRAEALGASWPRRLLGPEPLRRTWPWPSGLLSPPKPQPQSSVPGLKVYLGRFETLIQLHSSTRVWRILFWLFAEFESALNESAKALAQAAEQKEANRMAMSEAISAFCQVFGLDDVPSGSSPQSRLQALGGHVRGRLREALHHDVRWAFAVLASHYDVDLERVSEGYCLPDEDEAALAEVQRLDVPVAGPSAVLASSFEVEILLFASPSMAGADLAEGGNDAEGGDEAEGAAPPPGDAWFCRSSLFWTCMCLSRPPRPKHFVVML
jgi:hypothetical protein